MDYFLVLGSCDCAGREASRRFLGPVGSHVMRPNEEGVVKAQFSPRVGSPPGMPGSLSWGNCLRGHGSGTVKCNGPYPFPIAIHVFYLCNVFSSLESLLSLKEN